MATVLEMHVYFYDDQESPTLEHICNSTSITPSLEPGCLTTRVINVTINTHIHTSVHAYTHKLYVCTYKLIFTYVPDLYMDPRIATCAVCCTLPILTDLHGYNVI